MGQTFGITIGGVMFQNQIRTKLAALPTFASDASQLARDATELAALIKAMPEGSQKYELKNAYVQGLEIVWILSIALSAAAFFSSLTIKGYSLDVALDTKQGLETRARATDVEIVELEPSHDT